MVFRIVPEYRRLIRFKLGKYDGAPQGPGIVLALPFYHSSMMVDLREDVFDVEPVPQDSALWGTQNLRITAHIAAISHPHLIVPILVENYRRYTNRQPLRHVVDFDAGY